MTVQHGTGCPRIAPAWTSVRPDLRPCWCREGDYGRAEQQQPAETLPAIAPAPEQLDLFGGDAA